MWIDTATAATSSATSSRIGTPAVTNQIAVERLEPVERRAQPVPSGRRVAKRKLAVRVGERSGHGPRHVARERDLDAGDDAAGRVDDRAGDVPTACAGREREGREEGERQAGDEAGLAPLREEHGVLRLSGAIVRASLLERLRSRPSVSKQPNPNG